MAASALSASLPLASILTVLPMLLRVLTGRNGSLPGAIKRAISGGTEGLVHMNSDRCLDG